MTSFSCSRRVVPPESDEMTSSEGGSQMSRPFESGFETAWEISIALFHHVGHPLAQDQAHA